MKIKKRFVIVAASFFSMACHAADPVPQSLGEAMRQMKGSTSEWHRHAQRAFALQFGIPEERLKAVLPGFKWKTQPAALQPLLSGDPAALLDLIPLLKDPQVTRGVNAEGDSIGQMSVSNLVRTLADLLVPLSSYKEEPDLGIKEWVLQTAHLKPEQRLQLWFKSASGSQFTNAFALFLLTDHAPAWPLIENWLLSLNDFESSVLFSAAYVRHRREHAAEFFEKLMRKWEHSGQTGTEKIWHELFVVRNGRSLLVEPFTAKQRMEQFLAGTLSKQDLEEWTVRSFNLPWDYGISQAEPAILHLPVLDDMLLAALQTALTARDVSECYSLVELGLLLSGKRSDIVYQCEADELPPKSEPGDPSLKALTDSLRSLLKDNREVIEHLDIVSPAHAAAQIVLNRWSTNTEQLKRCFAE